MSEAKDFEQEDRQAMEDLIESRAKQLFQEDGPRPGYGWEKVPDTAQDDYRKKAREELTRGEDEASLSTDIQMWADEAMYTAEGVEEGGPKVYIINATTDPLGTLASACAMYEGKKVLRHQVTDEMRHYYWEDIKKTKLKAPLEAIELHFLIEGVTRAFTHQMVRQRTAMFVQESMRFAVKENMADEILSPPSIEPGSIEHGVWRAGVEAMGEAYNALIAMGVPAEDARGLAPTDVRTRLHYKSDFKNFTDQMGNRLCTQAQFEWRVVIARMVEALAAHESPGVSDAWQWKLIAESDYFAPPCYAAGHCTFRGDMDRHCKIRDRVEANQFDQIDPREWLADPTSARKAPVKS